MLAGRSISVTVLTFIFGHLRDERACSRRTSGYDWYLRSATMCLGVARRRQCGWARQMYAGGALRLGGTAVITTRPKSVPPSPAIVKPVTMINRLSSVPAESVAARIIT